MDSLDIQVVDSLTVNLNQEDYSTEGLVLNSIEIYIEDGLELFDAALTQDPITLYTEEIPEVIMLDTMKLVDSISRVESEINKTSKEATLLAKVAELKEALNTIDFTAIELKIELKIQNVENVTAREATLIQGIADVIRAIENIDFTDLENSIAEVKNAVINIDLSALAKENTLTQGIASISQKIDNIDLSSVENKIDEGVSTLYDKIDNIDLSAVAKESTLQEESAAIQSKIDNIKLPDIDTTELAKEATLNAVSSKLDNLNVEVDLSSVAKQGDNQEATNSAIYDAVKAIPELKNMYAAHFEPNDEGEDTYTMVLPLASVVDGDTLII